MSFIQPVKIAVIGAGKVGSTFAYTALLRGLASELVLIDKDVARAEGEAMDLQHTVPFSHRVEIRATDKLDVSGAAITVICAGRRPKPGEPPFDLLEHNAAVIKDIIPPIAESNPEGIVLIATTPADVLTYGAWKLSGLPRNQVIGGGTILQTARLRYLLGQHFGIEPRSVHAYVLGEDGDGGFPVWSSASIAGMLIPELCKIHGCERSALDAIFEQARSAATAIAQHKGSPDHAIATALAQIIESILHDQKAVFSVSSVMLGEYALSHVALSVPTVLGRGGIDRTLRLELTDPEVAKLLYSGRKLESAIHYADFSVPEVLKAS